MTQEVIKDLGKGGIGMHGQGVGSAFAAMRELQGLTFSLVGGQTTPNKHDLAALRTEDTIKFALNNNAGTLTDITANLTIVDTHATGTVTAAAVQAGDTVTVNGAVYTAIANGATPTSYKQFSVGANNNACATNLAAAINAHEAAIATKAVVAVANSAVVTITAVADGTAGNSIALNTSNGTRLAKSGTALAGGTATGGFTSSSTTNQVLLVWENKQ